MAEKPSQSAHTFHIPVMGTGFTVDTALHVAKYGISSVISLVDDVLIEQMRKYHCDRIGEPFEEIPDSDDDCRALRMTAYLDLVDRIVRRQVEELQASPFEEGSEITRYFEMLPETPLKDAYGEMLACTDPDDKARMQDELRRLAVPGSIDANIMTKLDRDHYRGGEKLAPEYADAMAALRGFALSTVEGSIVLSAGLNQRLYAYMAQFDDFFPDESGHLKKKITLKVSDYRSALIQGRYLAKRGLWVSEYRVESGLNCGGHAFLSAGNLMGPILEEFKEKKGDLVEKLQGSYAACLAAAGRPCPESSLDVRITVQGGIGTASENEFLLKRFDVDATGWATPFLLVSEVVNVDDELLEKLSSAASENVYMGANSPLNIPYWNLRTCAAEEARRRRIDEGKPGSSCPKKCLMLNSELTEIPICTASRNYVKRKLDKVHEEGLAEGLLARVTEMVLGKSCICHDLAGCATLKLGIDPDATPAVCPGPGIADFSKVSTLLEMVSHIYGRLSLPVDPDRPHMFIRELSLGVDYLCEEIEVFSLGLSNQAANYFGKFKANLLDGIEYYGKLSEELIAEERERFLEDLRALRDAIESLQMAAEPAGAGW